MKLHRQLEMELPFSSYKHHPVFGYLIHCSKGAQPLKEWNEILLVKQIWRIITKDNSLWSVWVNLVKLKGQSFWDIAPKQSDSWGWKFLLKLRDKVKDHVGAEIVNGSIKYHWITNGGKNVPFSTQHVWIDLKSNKECVSWYDAVWFKGYDPKQAFILWLTILNRLNTQDRMMKCLPFQDLECDFCGSEADSINHLFFKCDFSLKVWKAMKNKLIYRGLTDDLQGIIQGIALYPFKRNIWCILNRLVVAACVYFVWQDRNNRIFRKEARSEDVLCRIICSFIQCKLLTFKVKQSVVVNKVEGIWEIKWL
ncbi:uncharacterized protein [Rutidosis leptorrhynchoides]|uniref:uncharacterized protein n=1 Tax=Rutidosis leptorrhynchoides TaxID=125765 RepID=UPI003A98FAF3